VSPPTSSFLQLNLVPMYMKLPQVLQQMLIGSIMRTVICRFFSFFLFGDLRWVEVRRVVLVQNLALPHLGGWLRNTREEEGLGLAELGLGEEQPVEEGLEDSCAGKLSTGLRG